ncbi:PEGA domain-containing protein [Candidatus Saccharibacteria bacterium]|nr:PEGA domain-containing protein [Candidatus Saccharibacteria bacterium]
MERRKRNKKIRNARVMTANIFMAISVIVITAALLLFAMGFSFNDSGKLEQSGLLQVSSYPRSTTVEIDDENQFTLTNVNKMLPTGNHTLKVTKPGYDTWQRNVKIDAGLLTRIDWIRLFPLHPTIDNSDSFQDLHFVAFTPDRKHLLAIEKSSPNLLYIDLQGDRLTRRTLPLSDLLSPLTKTTTQTETSAASDSSFNVDSLGKIDIIAWNNDNTKLIATHKQGESVSWHLFDLETPANSHDLSTQFGLNFSNILIANDSASKLWALENNKLHLIDIANLTVGSAIADNVEQITCNKGVVSYIATNPTTKARTLNIYRDGENASTKILDLESDARVQLAMGTFWRDYWLAVSLNNVVEIYSDSAYPSSKKDSASFKRVFQHSLEYTPSIVSVNQESRILAYASEKHLTTIDFETKDYYDSTPTISLQSLSWLDDYLFYERDTTHHKVTVRDFDGSNQRELLSATDADFPINLTANNKYLYYFKFAPNTADTGASESETPQDSSATPSATYILKRLHLNI